MVSGTVEQVAKHSLLYSYLLTQPFATYVDANPVLQNEILLETENLEYGEHGEVVRILQQKLNTISYYEDNIDGDYGILTEYALKKFQADHNIEISGQTDRDTIIALINVEKENHLKRLVNLSDTVYPGIHGENVTVVQEALQYFGYYSGKIDGIYGPLTKQALEIAEKEHDIKLINEVPEESMTTLNEVTEKNEEVIEDSSTNENDEVIETKSVKKEKEITEAKEEETKPKEVEVKGSNHTGVIESARSLIGTPYVWGGESPSGFDCSGFIQYAFLAEDIVLPRTVSETWNFTQPVDAPSVGDLVFFETYQPGPSHMGIYLGDGRFIHAGSSRGVEISELSNSYWDERYLGAKRVNQN